MLTGMGCLGDHSLRPSKDPREAIRAPRLRYRVWMAYKEEKAQADHYSHTTRQ